MSTRVQNGYAKAVSVTYSYWTRAGGQLADACVEDEWSRVRLRRDPSGICTREVPQMTTEHVLRRSSSRSEIAAITVVGLPLHHNFVEGFEGPVDDKRRCAELHGSRAYESFQALS